MERLLGQTLAGKVPQIGQECPKIWLILDGGLPWRNLGGWNTIRFSYRPFANALPFSPINLS